MGDGKRLLLEQYKTREDYQNSSEDDETWDLERFKKHVKFVIVKIDGFEMEFDFIGVHTAIANALRRIMLSEVATMAIEKVYIYTNTSIIQDEVLSHRVSNLELQVSLVSVMLIFYL